jgi:hypothetical protein
MSETKLEAKTAVEAYYSDKCDELVKALTDLVSQAEPVLDIYDNEYGQFGVMGWPSPDILASSISKSKKIIESI